MIFLTLFFALLFVLVFCLAHPIYKEYKETRIRIKNYETRHERPCSKCKHSVHGMSWKCTNPILMETTYDDISGETHTTSEKFCDSIRKSIPYKDRYMLIRKQICYDGDHFEPKEIS